MLLQQRVNQLIQAADEGDQAVALVVETARGGRLRFDFPETKQSDQDGPTTGNRFRHGGKVANLSPLSYRILAVLWEERQIDMHELIEKAWEGRMPTSSAFWNAIHKLNTSLQSAAMTVLVTSEAKVVKLIGD